MPLYNFATGGSGGSGTINVTTIDDSDSPYTLTPSVNVLLVDTTNNPITVKLGGTSPSGEITVTRIKDIGNNAESNPITIDGDGVVTLDGDPTYVMSDSGMAIDVARENTTGHVL